MDSCPVRVFMRFPLDKLHTLISFPDPEAKYSPVGENAMLLTEY